MFFVVAFRSSFILCLLFSRSAGRSVRVQHQYYAQKHIFLSGYQNIFKVEIAFQGVLIDIAICHNPYLRKLPIWIRLLLGQYSVICTEGAMTTWGVIQNRIVQFWGLDFTYSSLFPTDVVWDFDSESLFKGD